MLLFIIYLAFISLGLPDSLLGCSWPVMQRDLAAAFALAGYLSMVVQGGTIVSSLYSNRLITRFGAGKVTLVSVAMTAVALFGFALTPGIPFLFVCAIPLGLGAGSVDAALNNFVARHYQARHMNWLHCFWGVGATTGPVIMSVVLLREGGWRMGYGIVAVIQVTLVLTLSGSLFLWPKNSTNENEGGEAAAASVKVMGNREALRLPYVKLALVSFIFYCAFEATTGLWMSSYLVRVRGFSAPDAARTASLFYGGITLGRFLSGFLAMKLRSVFLIRGGQILCVMGALLLSLPLPDFVLVSGVILMGLGAAPIFPGMLQETPVRFGAGVSQAVMGLQMAFAYIGCTFFPPLFGTLATEIGVGIFPCFILGCVVTMFVASEYLQRKLVR